MAKSEYTDLTYFMIYGYKLVKNSDTYDKNNFFHRVGRWLLLRVTAFLAFLYHSLEFPLAYFFVEVVLLLHIDGAQRVGIIVEPLVTNELGFHLLAVLQLYSAPHTAFGGNGTRL